MKKTRLIVFMLLGLVGAAHSQTIKGKVVDVTTNKPLSGATLTLTSVKDTLKKFNSLADAEGAFQFTGITKDSFALRMSYIEYDDYRQFIALNDSTPSVDLGTLFVTKKTTTLTDVLVTAKVPPVQQKGDTAQYNASQFKVNPDATVEDLIKKMPGITVGRDGTVTSQGQTVQKVTVDGRDFFGDDAAATLRNLPADVVDKIQTFDRLSDQSQFTGFDDGNAQRSINIVTKSGVTNGQFGRIYAGYGTDSRYAAGGNVSFFKGDRRISLVGNFNNINQQNFASQDILGAMTGGGGGGNRGGGGGGNFGGGGGNFGGGGGGFGIGQQSGISKTSAFGLNFGDKWGKKLDVQGSYFFNTSTNNNDQETNTLTNFPDGIQEQNRKSFSNSKNTNHRVNMRLTYTIDEKNSIIFTPNISFQNSKSNTENYTRTFFNTDPTNAANADSLNMSDVLNRSNRDGYNIRNNILYRHSFAKRGRTLSVNFSTALNKNNSESFANGYYRFFNRTGDFLRDSIQDQYSDNVTDGYTLSGNISYTEPIGKNSQLQFSYQPSYAKNNANQETYDYDVADAKYSAFKPSLSNKFENTTITQSGGVTYRLGASRDNQLSFGVNIQHTQLNSDRSFPTVTAVRQSFFNLLPNVMWRKKVSPKSTFQIFYRANTNQPSVTQLQDVLNLTNPTNVSVGNPNLKQMFSQVFTGRYTFTNTQKGQSFFANVSLQAANNYISNITYRIVNDTLIQGEKVSGGSNLSVPVNLDGFTSVGSLLTFSQPVQFIKSNVSLTTGLNYSDLPGLVQDVTTKQMIKTSTKSYTYTAGAVVASNINEYIDFNLSYNANFNNVKNTISADNNSVNLAAGAQVNLLTKNGWFLQNDVTNQSNKGLSQGFNQNFWLWNAAIGKKVFKKKQAEIKLSVFDLLKQNQSITRTVSGNTITDSKSRVITQYFMLTFTYSLKSFGTPAARGNNRGNFEGRGNFTPGGFGGQGGGMPGGFGGGRPNF